MWGERVRVVRGVWDGVRLCVGGVSGVEFCVGGVRRVVCMCGMRVGWCCVSVVCGKCGVVWGVWVRLCCVWDVGKVRLCVKCEKSGVFM